jgi:hypothetical protein
MGVIANGVPLQVTVVIALITARGLTVITAVKAVPKQPALLGVIV